MCDFPTELVLYNDNKFNIYIDNISSNSIEIKHLDIKVLWSFPLPNNRFILSIISEGKHKIIIGSYNSNELIIKDIFLNNIPPVVDGTFVSNEFYYKINSYNTIEVIKLKDNNYKIIPANIKSDIHEQMTTNINNLLVVKFEYGTVHKYNDSKEYSISEDEIIAWFDNRYILTIKDTYQEYESSFIKLYDISRSNESTYSSRFHEGKIVKKTIPIPITIALISNKDLGLSDFKGHYVRSASDDSIDVFLYDSNNITY